MKNTKLLLIDTTGKALFVALVGENDVQVAPCQAEQRRHSESLNDIAAKFLPEADAFAVVTCGDGSSWTGIRVGVVAVKAWALATGKPIIALGAADNETLIATARKKFTNKDFTDVFALAPHYDSEFKVTLKK